MKSKLYRILGLFFLIGFFLFSGNVNAQDSDGDGIANTVDLDDDNDGILDTVEGICTSTSPLSSTGWKATVYDAPVIDAWGQISASTTFPTPSYSQIATFDYNENAGTTNAFSVSFASGTIGISGSNPKAINYVGTSIAGTPTNTNEDYAIMFRKTITAQEAGTYAFDFLYGDDHLFIYKNGVKVYQLVQAYSVAPTNNVATITVVAGDVISLLAVEENLFNTEIKINGRKIAGTCYLTDTDGDGIPNYLDLDSDNDGCTDAIEGDESVTAVQLLTASGTVTVGTGSSAGNQNLGIIVDANGVPTVVNSGGAADIGSDQGQGIGLSQDYTKSGCKDADGDGVIDSDDLDDDNDGILDNTEGQCTSLSKTSSWTASGTQATGTSGSVGITYNSTPLVGANTNNLYTPTGNFNGTNFWYSAGIAGSFSLEFLHTWDTSPETPIGTALAATDGGTRQVTITFATPINKLLLNVDRLGGSGSDSGGNPYISNSTEFTLTTANTTMSKLAGNSQLIVSGNKFYRLPNVDLGTSNPLGEANATTGTAAGTVQIVKNDGSSFTSVTFTLAGIGSEGSGGDGIEMIFETCKDRDTDGDTIPDYLDLDSDNDGCLDALEGGTALATSNLVTAGGTVTVGTGSTASNQNLCAAAYTGTVTDCVGSTGVPLAVNQTSGQTVGSSANNLVKATICSVCYELPTDLTTSVPVNHGITLITRAGSDNGNWPMLRNSAYTALESKTKGFVITRNANPESTILAPVVGMMVFDTDATGINGATGCLKIYTGSAVGEGWKCFNSQTCP